MTWLELINELRKQPMWLLEQEVMVCWDDLDSEECRNVPDMDVVQLVCPTNEFEDPTLWTEDSGCSVSLTVMPEKQKRKKFLIQTSTILGQSFFIDADDKDDARVKACELVNNERFFDDHMHAKWSYDNEWNATGVIDVIEDLEPEDDEVYIAPEVVDSYLEEE